MTKSRPKLPKLTRGGNRCPDCKHEAASKGQHHVCRRGHCTTCKHTTPVRGVPAA